jgi:hypothetical protein
MLAVLLAAGVTGAVSISVLDRTGAMVTDLRAEEVTLKEAGQTRAIRRVERDRRPLALAMLVDSSEALGKGFLRDLADPVMDFLESLPPDVDRTLMTIGTPPEVVSLQDPVQARTALRAKPPFGKLSLYDGIAEACNRLAQKRASRRDRGRHDRPLRGGRPAKGARRRRARDARRARRPVPGRG